MIRLRPAALRIAFAVSAAMTLQPLVALPVLAQEAPAAAQPSPRQTVSAVATRIRDLYFDPARGARIADALEAQAATGAFDALTDGPDLAAALTARLKPEDAHFNVVHDPAAMDPRPGPRPSGPRTPGASPEARGHYGFRRAEILPGNIGYVEITGFSGIDFANPDDPARKAADSALAFVAGADAVIFDVRNNGGGAPSMVGYLVSAFTPADAPIYNIFHSREGTQSEAPGVFFPDPRLTTPVYILTSARSGSAAEAFPYTMQAAKRAIIVGDATGGAANPGGMAPAGGGFAIFVSDGSPVNPITGRNWEGTGVQPDIATPWNQALAKAQELALQAIVVADSQRTDAAWALEALLAPNDPVDLGPYVGNYGERTVRLIDGRLAIASGRRPPVVLAPLGDDLFSVVGDPSRRYRFTVQEGRAVSFDLIAVGGPPMRARRTD